MCHKVSQPARGPPGSVPQASVTHWETRLVFAGVDPALRQWCYGLHEIENPLLTHPSPTQDWGAFFWASALRPCIGGGGGEGLDKIGLE